MPWFLYSVVLLLCWWQDHDPCVAETLELDGAVRREDWRMWIARTLAATLRRDQHGKQLANTWLAAFSELAPLANGCLAVSC